MTRCVCGRQTDSFYDVVGKEGKKETITCCFRCIRKLTKGLHHSPNGDVVKEGNLIRWFNREYKPMEQINWLFFLASR